MTGVSNPKKTHSNSASGSQSGSLLDLHLSNESSGLPDPRQSLIPAFEQAERSEDDVDSNGQNATASEISGLSQILREAKKPIEFEFDDDSQSQKLPEESDLPFHDMKIYVEVLDGKTNQSQTVSNVINRMGANIAIRISRKVNLVVFAQGRQWTIDKAKEFNIPVVSVFWVEKCRKDKCKVDYDDFLISNEAVAIPSPDLFQKFKVQRLPPVERDRPIWLSQKTLDRRQEKKERNRLLKIADEKYKSNESTPGKSSDSDSSESINFEPMRESQENHEQMMAECRERVAKLVTGLHNYRDADGEVEFLVTTPLSARVKKNLLEQNLPIPDVLTRALCQPEEGLEPEEASSGRMQIQSRASNASSDNTSISCGPITFVIKSPQNVETRTVAVNTSTQTRESVAEEIVNKVTKEMTEEPGKEAKAKRHLSKGKQDEKLGSGSESSPEKEEDNGNTEKRPVENEQGPLEEEEKEPEPQKKPAKTPKTAKKRKSDEAAKEKKRRKTFGKCKSTVPDDDSLLIHTTSERLNQLQLGIPTSEEFVGSCERRKKRFKRRKPLRDIVMTNLPSKDREAVFPIMKKLGKFQIDTCVGPDTTHVICGESKRRTLNIVQAIARGLWLVSVEWVFRSLEQGKWLDEAEFELISHFPMCKTRRLQRENGNLDMILADVGPIYACHDSKPAPADLYSVIQVLGGKISPTTKRASIVIGQRQSCASPMFVKDNVPVVKEQWILDCVEQGKLLQWQKYLDKSPDLLGTPVGYLKRRTTRRMTAPVVEAES